MLRFLQVDLVLRLFDFPFSSVLAQIALILGYLEGIFGCKSGGGSCGLKHQESSKLLHTLVS